MLFIWAAFVALFSVIMCSSIQISILALVGYLLYPAIGLEIYLSYSRKDCLKLLDFTLKCGFAACIFGVFQYVFFNRLDSRFLLYKSSGYLYSYFNNQAIYRSTGLMENTIVYGFFTLTISLLTLSRAIFQRKIKIGWLFCFFVDAVACLMTYGRFVIFCLLIGTFFLIFSRLKKRPGARLAFVLVLAIIVICFLSSPNNNSAILNRLFSNDKAVQASNEEHLTGMVNALKLIREHFFTGLGFGTEGYYRGRNLLFNVVITDGAWFGESLELGVIPVIFMLLFFVLLFKHFIQNKKKEFYQDRWLFEAMPFVLLFVILSGFVNSSFFARANNALFYLLVFNALAVEQGNPARRLSAAKSRKPMAAKRRLLNNAD